MGSALTGKNIDKLLGAIIATSEIQELKANPNRLGIGVVIESSLDKGLGPVATIIVKNGSVVKGDMMIAGSSYGRIRAMFDENGKEVQIAKPSQPVKITGLNNVPSAGDHFAISNNEKDIKEIAEKIRLHQIQLQNAEHDILTKDTKFNTKKLVIILKTDVHGSLEAIKNVLTKTHVEGVSLVILRAATGGITKSDVELAKASNGIIIGFNVKPIKSIKDLANNQKVQIFFFDVIYHLAEEIENIMKGKLDPVYVDEDTGEAEIKNI